MEDDNPWLTPQTEQDTYFIIVNKYERTIKAGEQIFFTYGRRTNQYLLLHYSFSYEDNMYDFRELTLNMEPVSRAPVDCVNREIDPENVQTVYLKVE